MPVTSEETRSWKWYGTGILWAVVLASCLAIGGWAAHLRHEPVHHFGVVVDGVLYRSAQPDPRQWQQLHHRYGIRTVINLRDPETDEAWALFEKKFCAENGIRLVNLPVGPDRLTAEELRTVVETVSDPASQPVLVHCELGKSRTGVVIAAYRIVAQGWSDEAAIAESQRYKEIMNPGYAAYLKELAAGRPWRPATAPSQPAGEPTSYR